MYLTFDEYTGMGGSTWAEEDYETAEEFAAIILDDFTLGRLQTVDWSSWEGRVRRCMYVILEALPSLQDAYSSDTSGGRGVTQFSNGIDQFSLVSSLNETDSEAILSALHRQLLMLLPIELCSVCVWYNDAN